MKLGVTGTRFGLTDPQASAVEEVLRALPAPTEFRHGGCRGVDVQVARLIRELFPTCRIICHPGPIGDEWQDLSGVDNEARPPRTYFARNRAIVDAVEHLLVVPKAPPHQARGGTWYTHDYAKKRGVHAILVRT